jgi:hypothetical protein
MTRLEAYRERYANIHFDRQTGLALKGWAALQHRPERCGMHPRNLDQGDTP